MRVVQIPKGNGKSRTIYIPSRKKRRELRTWLPDIIQRAQRAAAAPGISHGVLPGTSPVTMAHQHAGRRWSVSFDLQSCFDHVTTEKLQTAGMPEAFVTQVTVDGAARQGLPTSSACAELALTKLDKSILTRMKKRGWNVVYSRYVDDLCFSGDEEKIIPDLLNEIPSLCAQTGFPVSKHKTKVQKSASGRRIICGISVGENDLRITRTTKRKMRAASRQGNKSSLDGFMEWGRMKFPRKFVVQQARKNAEAAANAGSPTGFAAGDPPDALERLGKTWRVGVKGIAAATEKKGPDVYLGDDCWLTGDPAMILGASTWTTGWGSCLTHPRGSKRGTTRLLVLLEGCRIAFKASGGKMIVNGVERPKMAARAFVWTLRDVDTGKQGVAVFDRLYGDQTAGRCLAKALESHGIQPASEVQDYPDARVVGNCPATGTLWLDNLKSSRAQFQGRTVRVLRLKPRCRAL